MSADSKFGGHSGQYVLEALAPVIEELADAYERYAFNNEDDFVDDLRTRLWDFNGQSAPLRRVDRLSGHYDHEIYPKREDLPHGDMHKLNNTLGRVLLARYMGKERITAETDAGQCGTAAAMACVRFGIPCKACMGERDTSHQRPNVSRVRLNDSEINLVTVGHDALKEAISETMCDWATNAEDTYHVIGLVIGPHPFLGIIQDFRSVISEEARVQAREKLGRPPDAVVTCADGGSSTMGAFAESVGDERTMPYAVEAGGSTFEVNEEADVAPNSALLTTGSEDILHGAHTRLLQDRDDQITESHSMSSDLDYVDASPELTHLVGTDCVTTVGVDDDMALTTFHRLSQTEGIIPTLELAHAFSYLEPVAGPDAPDAENASGLGEYVMVNVFDRDGKDLELAIKETYERNIDIAPNMDELTGGL